LIKGRKGGGGDSCEAGHPFLHPPAKQPLPLGCFAGGGKGESGA